MTPPNLSSLLAAATPGPWTHASSIRGGWVIVQDANEYPLAQMDGAIDSRLANAQLIARLNPAVMAKVLEALTLANLNYSRTNNDQPDIMGDDEFEAWGAVRKALDSLNGLTAKKL